jgi:hypothetical protein
LEPRHAFICLCVRFHTLAPANDLCVAVGLRRRRFSKAASTMAVWLTHTRGWLLTHTAMWDPHLDDFAAATWARGAYVPGCVGFVDGTAVETCPPGRGLLQESMYNGYYGCKFLSAGEEGGDVTLACAVCPPHALSSRCISFLFF